MSPVSFLPSARSKASDKGRPFRPSLAFSPPNASSRIPDNQTLTDEIAAWEHDRNAHHTKSEWRFTTNDARIKLKRLYPSV